MKRFRRYIPHIAVFAGLTAAVYLLMVFAAAIPNSAIQRNMRQSALQYMDTDRYALTEDGLFQNITDNHADQMWLNIGWQMGSGNPFRSALDTKYYDGMEHGTTAGLYLTITRGKEANAEYSRYWHATAGLMRIAHLFMDIRGIKFFGMVGLTLLILQTLISLFRRGHGDFGLCLVLSLLLVQVWNLRLSVEYLPCFVICFALCPHFLRLERKGNFHLELLSVISGTITASFDFLTTETVTILVPLILVMAVRSRERRLGSPQKVLKLLLRCCLCWLLAYAGSFVIKWVAVSLATGQNHILTAVESAGKRVGGVVTAGQIRKKPNAFMAIAANFSTLFEGTSRTDYVRAGMYPVIIILLALLIYWMCRTRQKRHPGTLFLLLLGCAVILRYGVLANHSFMHAFFTYRALISTILGLLTAMALNLRPSAKEGGMRQWS